MGRTCGVWRICYFYMVMRDGVAVFGGSYLECFQLMRGSTKRRLQEYMSMYYKQFEDVTLLYSSDKPQMPRGSAYSGQLIGTAGVLITWNDNLDEFYPRDR